MVFVSGFFGDSFLSQGVAAGKQVIIPSYYPRVCSRGWDGKPGLSLVSAKK